MIEKLEMVDARLAEAGWMETYEHRKSLAEVAIDLQHLLHQHGVIRRLEFEKQKPENRQLCCVIDNDGTVLNATYIEEDGMFYTNGYRRRFREWFPKPTVV